MSAFPFSGSCSAAPVPRHASSRELHTAPGQARGHAAAGAAQKEQTASSPRQVQLVGEESDFSLLPLPFPKFSGCQATALLLLICLLLSPCRDLMLFFTPPSDQHLRCSC